MKKTMKKPIIRALLMGAVFVIVYYGVQIIGGVYITEHYVPDITEQYASVDNLQNTVTISWQADHSIWPWLQVLLVMLIGVAVYYSARLLKSKLSK
ncbi:hypothetical protein SAMN04487969_101213 [Paenibacillus algorifonticola]|uniref:Uncharacterized protein n=1 Tax=Paenibacillus algorifonticola TaxID=684063 RepID=A0A1I1Y0A0_9BACL|nr:hypothetical protein [Paenibacillus algorifonticola]SFE12976.1 hypothetical protein SAMN04487969_101213 [Paenibacillus algorifonticola]